MAPAEAVEVGEAGAAELVDRLVVVGDDEHVAAAADQGLHQPRLGVVRVLVLVDHDEAHRVADVTAHRGVLAQQPLGDEDAVVVVEHRLAAVALLESAVELGALGVALEQRLPDLVGADELLPSRPCRVLLGGDQLLLRGLDEVEQGSDQVVGTQRIPEGARPHLGEHRLEVEPPLRRVGDVEARRHPDAPAPLAQDPPPEGVEVDERHLVAGGPVERLGAAAHLRGGLHRVGEHQLLGGAHPRRAELEEALDDDPGLPRARPGEHQAGALPVVDGRLLVGIEGDRGHRGLSRAHRSNGRV